jgi:hypothetical protein
MTFMFSYPFQSSVADPWHFGGGSGSSDPCLWPMDPDPYIWLVDPDPGGPKTCGSGGSRSGFGSGSATLVQSICMFFLYTSRYSSYRHILVYEHYENLMLSIIVDTESFLFPIFLVRGADDTLHCTGSQRIVDKGTHNSPYRRCSLS